MAMDIDRFAISENQNIFAGRGWTNDPAPGALICPSGKSSAISQHYFQLVYLIIPVDL
jgi:hypothetical protein